MGLTKEGTILKRFEGALLAEDQEEEDDAFYGVQDLFLDIGISPLTRLTPAIGKGITITRFVFSSLPGDGLLSIRYQYK